MTAKDHAVLIYNDGLGDPEQLVVLDQEGDLTFRVFFGIAAIGL